MNPIQPIQPPAAPRTINVIEPISPALARVKRMLFQPFDLGKWFIIGFCAWLAGLGESGAGFHGPGSGKPGRRQTWIFATPSIRPKNYLVNNAWTGLFR